MSTPPGLPTSACSRAATSCLVSLGIAHLPPIMPALSPRGCRYLRTRFTYMRTRLALPVFLPKLCAGMPSAYAAKRTFAGLVHSVELRGEAMC
jgi:hypothetical protein